MAGHSQVAHLGGPSDHVLDEVPMTRGIDDGHIVLAGFKFPQWNVDGNATLPLCLQLVQHPGVLKWPLPHLGGKQIVKGSQLVRFLSCSERGAIQPGTVLLPVSTYLRGFLLKLLDGPLVDAPTLVDEVTSGGGLARVHMANHNNVYVEFLLSHGDWSWLKLWNGLSAKISITYQLGHAVVAQGVRSLSCTGSCACDGYWKVLHDQQKIFKRLKIETSLLLLEGRKTLVI